MQLDNSLLIGALLGSITTLSITLGVAFAFLSVFATKVNDPFDEQPDNYDQN